MEKGVIMHRTISTIAKTKPKTYIFPVAFRGERGGIHEIKMRFTLDGITQDNSKANMERLVVRAIEKGYLIRFVNWYEKTVGTNYGRGDPRGLLVYKCKARDALNHPKVKKGWHHAGMKFWEG